MYALVIGGAVAEVARRPYNLVRLEDGAKTLVSPYITDDIYATCGWFPVVDVSPPYDAATQVLERGIVVLVGDVPTQQYIVRAKTPAELAAEAAAAQEETEREQARQAITNLRDYENLNTPTNAQTVAVVRLLCRVCIALIRNTFRAA